MSRCIGRWLALAGIGAAGFVLVLHQVLSSEWAHLAGFSRGVRQFMRRYGNPVAVALAERLPTFYVLIRHVGRRSGRRYTTPVVAIPAAGAWYVPLTYGPGTDWCRNVLAADAATLAVGGRDVPLRDPQVVRTGDVLPRLPWRWRLMVRAAGMPWVLALREAASTAVSTHAG